jgi:tetratricopeptide (TPR) repeat protein
MADFAAALAPFADDAPRLPVTAEYAPTRRRRQWLGVAAGALLLVVALGALWYATGGKSGAPAGGGPAKGLAGQDPARQKLARRLVEGRRLLDARQFDKVAAVADQALALDPRSPGALALRGAARAGLGRPEEALADCAAALKQNPETALAYRTRGLLLLGQGLADEAIADFTVAARLEPDDPRDLAYRGLAFLGKGEVAQAVADGTEALNRGPRGGPAPRRPRPPKKTGGPAAGSPITSVPASTTTPSRNWVPPWRPTGATPTPTGSAPWPTPRMATGPWRGRTARGPSNSTPRTGGRRRTSARRPGRRARSWTRRTRLR